LILYVKIAKINEELKKNFRPQNDAKGIKRSFMKAVSFMMKGWGYGVTENGFPN
jgi:hypothetical protein